MRSVEERLEAVMTAPLDELIVAKHQVRLPEAAARKWRLPEADRSALSTWGLPDSGVMTPRYQSDNEPTLVPNVVGDQERRLIDPHNRLYDVGQWGANDMTPKMGVDSFSGRVLGIRPAPVTAADLHPDLRVLHRDLYQPAVTFINSSVVQLVDISWRWQAAVTIIISLDEPWTDEEHQYYKDRIEVCERIVLSGIARIDPALPADDPKSLWRELVTDPGC